MVRRPDRAGGRGGRVARRSRARDARGPRARARQAARVVRPPARGPHVLDRGGGPGTQDVARRPPRVQDGRHVRRRVPRADPVPLLDLRGAGRGATGRTPARGDPGGRPQPHRTGDRVRLRVRARGVRARRGGVRVRDGQLEPGDRLDRLRHERAPVLRAGVDRGRPGGVRGRTADRRDLPVRRADAAADGQGPRGGRVPRPRDAGVLDRPGRGSREVRRAPARARHPGARARRGERPSRRPGRSPRGSGTPSWFDRPTCSAGVRWRSCTARTSSNGSSRAPRRPAPTTRC